MSEIVASRARPGGAELTPQERRPPDPRNRFVLFPVRSFPNPFPRALSPVEGGTIAP